MGFVNEYISEEDAKRYDLERIDRKYNLQTRDWTIDRDRNVYLRRVFSGREEISHQPHLKIIRGPAVATVWGRPQVGGWMMILAMSVSATTLQSVKPGTDSCLTRPFPRANGR